MTNKTITVKVPKPKTYQFKDKTVIAVPETHGCEGCVFVLPLHGCEMDSDSGAIDCYKVQKANSMPICHKENIIFKLTTDENI